MSNGVRTVFSGKPDYKMAESSLKHYENLLRKNEGSSFEKYVLLSEFFQSLFISEDGYVIDTGNFENVNLAILENILENVKKHPTLWKMFMVC